MANGRLSIILATSILLIARIRQILLWIHGDGSVVRIEKLVKDEKRFDECQ